MHGTSSVQSWFPGLVFLPIVYKCLWLFGFFLMIQLMTSFSLLKQCTNPLLLSLSYFSLEYSDLYCLQIISENKTEEKKQYLKVSLPGIECYKQFKKAESWLLIARDSKVGLLKGWTCEEWWVLHYRRLLQSLCHRNISHHFCITLQTCGGHS